MYGTAEGLDIIEQFYNQEDRYCAFGEGFYRWVSTHQLQLLNHRSYDKIRKSFDKLAKQGLIIRKSEPGCFVRYSLKEKEGYTIRGDYFIKTETLKQPIIFPEIEEQVLNLK